MPKATILVKVLFQPSRSWRSDTDRATSWHCLHSFSVSARPGPSGSCAWILDANNTRNTETVFIISSILVRLPVLLSIVFTARRDDFHIAPSVRRCEKLARQAKPPAPPTLQTLAQQGRWGRRFRLPGRRNQFFTPRQRGDGLASKPVPALTLGAMWTS